MYTNPIHLPIYSFKSTFFISLSSTFSLDLYFFFFSPSFFSIGGFDSFQSLFLEQEDRLYVVLLKLTKTWKNFNLVFFVFLSKKEERMKKKKFKHTIWIQSERILLFLNNVFGLKKTGKITYFSYLFLSLTIVFFLLTHLVGNIHSTWVQCVYLHPIHFWKDFNRSLQDHLSFFSLSLILLLPSHSSSLPLSISRYFLAFFVCDSFCCGNGYWCVKRFLTVRDGWTRVTRSLSFYSSIPYR